MCLAAWGVCASGGSWWLCGKLCLWPVAKMLVGNKVGWVLQGGS